MTDTLPRPNHSVDPRSGLKVNRKERCESILAEKGYEVFIWEDGYRNDQSKLIANCSEHGVFMLSASVIVDQGSVCQKCAKKASALKLRIPEDKLIERFKEVIGEQGIFLGFEEAYLNSQTTVFFECFLHGVWRSTARRVYAGKSCPKCAKKRGAVLRTLTVEQAEIDLRSEALRRGNTEFVKWRSEYKNSRSKAVFNCSKHGEYLKSLLKFKQGQGCPGCARGGFDVTKPGVLYILKSKCLAYQKVGITNSLQRRMYDLARSTPFAFSLEDHFESSGQVIRDVEQKILKSFKSCGFLGFDGSSEWLLADPSILEAVRGELYR